MTAAMSTSGSFGTEKKEPIAALPPYPDRFYAAARYAAVPGTVEVPAGNENTTPYTDLTCLALYSLYQQASKGPCKGPKPWAWNLVDLAKWQSWKELGNMAPVEAMRLFVLSLEEEDPDWWKKAQALEAAAQEAEALLSPGGVIKGSFGASELELAQDLLAAESSKWVAIPTKGRKPIGRYQHAAVVLNNKMYVVGGTSGRFMNDVQILDLATLTWSKLELSTESGALPPSAGHSLVVQDDHTLLAVGGYTKDGSDHLIVRALDLQTFSWRILKTHGTAPAARGGHSVSMVGSSLWVFAGEDSKRHLLNDLHHLDLSTLGWTAVSVKGEVPSPRADHSAVVYNSRYLTVFGGGSHSFCYNDIHVLDFETKEWMKVDSYGSVPTPRAGHSGVTVATQWFIAGGGDNKRGVSETLVLDLDTLEWSVVSDAPQRTPLSSEGLSLVKVEGPSGPILLAFGGYNGKYNNELLALKPEVKIPDLSVRESENGDALHDTHEGSNGIAENGVSDAKEGEEDEEAPVEEGAGEGVEGEGEKGVEATPEASGAEKKIEASEPAPPVQSGPDDALIRQLEEAEAALARAEKIALNARSEANFESAHAKADAWLAISKSNKEVEELKEKLAGAVEAKLTAEDELREGEAKVMAAQAAVSSVQAEAQKLRKDLAESRVRVHDLEAELLRIGSDAELTTLRKEYDTCKKALAEAQHELNSSRDALTAEQARCFRLEVEVAELRQRASEVGDLQHELHLLRRQNQALEEAVKQGGGGGRGWGGWISGAPK